MTSLMFSQRLLSQKSDVSDALPLGGALQHPVRISLMYWYASTSACGSVERGGDIPGSGGLYMVRAWECAFGQRWLAF